MNEPRSVVSFVSGVEAFLRRHGLAPGRRLVVGVSGGPDSLALLLALARLAPRLGLSLHVAHLDHGLRPGVAQEDARFVQETAHSLGLECTLGRADVPAMRRRLRLSLEEAARKARYDFLLGLTARRGDDALLLAHTLDDQAETVLLHLLRGAGLAGLRGMEPLSHRRHEGRDVLVARPLLEVPRGETEAFCRALDVRPRQDESNLSPRFLRNRLRHELLPLMERYNPAVRRALARTARSLARDLHYLEEQMEAAWPDVAFRTGEALRLDRRALRSLHPSLRAHLLRRAVAELRGHGRDLEQAHVEEMLRLLAGPTGSSLDLPGGLRFQVRPDVLLLAPAEVDDCPLPPLEGVHPLAIPGLTRCGPWTVEARVTQSDEAAGDPYAAVLDPAALEGPVRVRTRRPGDRFQPLGMRGHKKLQDFLVDEKVPRPWRDRVPLVESETRGILWVVGLRVAHPARWRGGDGVLLRFRLRDGGAPGPLRPPFGRA